MNRYILITEPNAEHVAEYTRAEMVEIFTAEERAALEAGEVVTDARRGIRYIDMTAAARAVRDRVVA